MKYHINNDDEVKKCSAKPGNCRFGDVEHFDSLKDAEKGLEKRFENFSEALTKNGNTREDKPDTVSAEISKNYGHISILENHMHNGGDTGNMLELYYYASPAGRIELQRRIGFDDNMYADDYIEIQKSIDAGDFDASKIEGYLSNLDSEIQNSIQKGQELLRKDFAKGDSPLLSDDWSQSNQEEKAVRHYLVSESDKWYRNLSTEQQAAIGQLTSNGFQKLQYGLGIENKNQNVNYIFDDTVDIKEISDRAKKSKKYVGEELRKEFTKNAEDFTNDVRISFENAPLLDEPVITYRGTSMHEIRDLLNVSEGLEFDAYDDEGVEPDNNLVNDLLSGKFNNQSVNSESRLRKVPVSTSVSASEVKRFGEGEVFLEIKRKTSTSPVNNGAWGSYEQEMLSNPLSDYKIIGAMETWHEFGNRKGVVLQLEEIVE